MMRKYFLLLSLMAFVAAVRADEKLDTFKSIYSGEMDKIVAQHAADMEQVNRAYLDYLDAELKKATDRADLDAYDKVEAEKKRFQSEKTFPANAPVQSLLDQAELKKNAATLDLSRKYLVGLKNHMSALMKAKDIEAARSVQEETKKVEGVVDELAKQIPVESRNPDVFKWKEEKTGLSYSYVGQVKAGSMKGTFSYEDSKCDKLLDGVVKGKRWGPHSVGWLDEKPPAIRCLFKRKVTPKAVRIYVWGKDSGGGVGIPDEITVFRGAMANTTGVIGKKENLSETSGWVEIPLDTTAASSSFVIQLGNSSDKWVMIDEIEFM